MKIGIIGSGIVGQVLAKAFMAEAQTVTLGTRNPGKTELDRFKAENPSVAIAGFAQTAASSQLLVLATAGRVAAEALELAQYPNLDNKIIIDTTNPISEAPPENGVLRFFTDHSESLMEKLQHKVPGAHLVKAFSCVGNALMYKPQLSGGTPTMFICGNNEPAKQTVKGILASFGWETADMGKATAARAIEPLCMLWCIPGFLQGQWYHAFKLLK